MINMASYQKRGENSFLLIVETGYNNTGKRLKKTRTIRIDDEKLLKTTKRLNDYLETELAKFKIEIEAGEYIAPEKMILDLFVQEEWRTKYAEHELAPLTFKNYNLIIKNHILPAIGHMRLDEIKPLHILTIIDKSSKAGARIDGHGDTLSSGSVEYIYRVLKNIFSRALAWQLIKKHPMEGIKKPKVTQADIQYYDEVEAQLALDALNKEPDMWRLFFTGALLGGFRRGELIALEFKEVNFANNSIFINKSISLTQNGEAAIKRPKSKSSTRIVTMPEWYMAELKEYYDKWIDSKINADNQWAGGDKQYVFHIGFGKPLYHSTPTHWWKRFTLRHNLKPASLHSLRHSTASYLLINGISMKAVQVRLGHARYQTTADLYRAC